MPTELSWHAAKPELTIRVAMDLVRREFHSRSHGRRRRALARRQDVRHRREPPSCRPIYRKRRQRFESLTPGGPHEYRRNPDRADHRRRPGAACISAMRLRNNGTSCGRFSTCSTARKVRSPRCWRAWSKADNSSRTRPRISRRNHRQPPLHARNSRGKTRAHPRGSASPGPQGWSACTTTISSPESSAIVAFSFFATSSA